MGDVARVDAWIDRSRVIPTKYVDAPATIMFQFKSLWRYGVLDFAYMLNLVMDSIYYADDDRVEVIGDKGVIFINRCDRPPCRRGRRSRMAGRPLSQSKRFEWHAELYRLHPASDRRAHKGRPTEVSPGKAVLAFSLAALKLVRPKDLEVAYEIAR